MVCSRANIMYRTEFYEALRQYLQCWKITPLMEKVGRQKVLRVYDRYELKGNKLYYTGPSKTYMRLVVLSDEQKRAVLEECHNNPATGNHNGVRSTRDRVVARYYWSTLKQDVTDWVKNCHHCQLKDPAKMEAPVLDPIKVNDAWKVVDQDPEDELNRRLTDIKALNEKVCSNIEEAQQKKDSAERKRKRVRMCSQEAADEVLIGENPKKHVVGDTLQDWHEGPIIVSVVSLKDVATVSNSDAPSTSSS